MRKFLFLIIAVLTITACTKEIECETENEMCTLTINPSFKVDTMVTRANDANVDILVITIYDCNWKKLYSADVKNGSTTFTLTKGSYYLVAEAFNKGTDIISDYMLKLKDYWTYFEKITLDENNTLDILMERNATSIMVDVSTCEEVFDSIKVRLPDASRIIWEKSESSAYVREEPNIMEKPFSSIQRTYVGGVHCVNLTITGYRWGKECASVNYAVSLKNNTITRIKVMPCNDAKLNLTYADQTWNTYDTTYSFHF